MTEEKKKWNSNSDDFDDDWQDEPEEEEGGNPWKSLLLFGGMVLAAGIVCTVVWVSSHSGGNRQTTPMAAGTPESGVNETLADPQVKMTDTGDSQDGETPSASRETEEKKEMVFSETSGIVTPKEYVNLRTEPSTTGGESTIFCQVQAGEKLNLTGYNLEHGWSRVEYEGQVLYVVTSLTEMVSD